jgi:hypothetical protein
MPRKVVRNEGDAIGALASTTGIIKADYYIPHIAHSTARLTPRPPIRRPCFA